MCIIWDLFLREPNVETESSSSTPNNPFCNLDMIGYCGNTVLGALEFIVLLLYIDMYLITAETIGSFSAT